MYLLYSLLLTLGFIILSPRFAIDAFRRGKYVTGLSERLGNLPGIETGRPIIWLHCVSVGETRAAQTLVRGLRQQFPNHSLVVSTTTVTGHNLARSVFAREAAAVFYFPIDWAWTVRRALRAVKPAAVLIMETEIWPRFLKECKTRKIPVALVNGRISNTSFRRYVRIRGFIRRALNNLTVALMQSDADAARVRQLGLDEARIGVLGNLKFDTAESTIDERLTNEVKDRFGLNGTQPLLIAASTHAPEERIVLEAFQRLRDSANAPRLMIAPRHPERFNEVAALLQGSGLRWSRRSDQSSANDKTCDVILLDTIGELNSVYPLAGIVFVGGSLVPHGGQNVLEPAATGACVITGPHTENFAAITHELLANRGLIQLHETNEITAADELTSVIRQMLADSPETRGIGERAQEVCRKNAGATERTLEVLKGILSTPVSSSVSLPLSAVHVTAGK